MSFLPCSCREFETFSKTSPTPAIRVVVLHDDHLTGTRGARIARAIAGEMGLLEECETTLWNIDLLDTLFGRAAALDASTADILIIALRGNVALSLDLKMWLRRWLFQAKQSSTALIAVFESPEAPAAEEARAFIQRAARGAGKEFFSQPPDDSLTGGASEPREFLWVL